MSSVALRRLPWQVVVGANGRQLSSAVAAARESKALKEDSAVQSSVEGGSFAMDVVSDSVHKAGPLC